MNIFSYFAAKIDRQINALVKTGDLPSGMDLSNVTVEPPRDAAHGDIATNAAMVLAKRADMKPRDLAKLIVGRLIDDAEIEKIDIAGPGFINISVGPALYHGVIRTILEQHESYGDSDMGGNKAVNVEYVSANPTGPMHVGHCRGAVFGDALCALLEKAGSLVTREYYINDAGAQIDDLARSAYLRYREALGEEIEIPEGLYPGDYLKPVGEQIAAADGKKWLDVGGEADWIEHFRVAATQAMMKMIRVDLSLLGIEQDVFFSERSLLDEGQVDAVLDELSDRGLIYTGVLEPPKGKRPDDWEARPQTLFRATEFGDDIDRPLMKTDGSWTYFASDIAYHKNKYDRGFAQMIDVWGADHGGYVKRLKSAVIAITDGAGELDVKLCQLVRLFRNGKPVKMSKRGGTFVTLAEVVEEVGKDVVRFIMLTRKNDAPLDFDFAGVVEQSRDNPVFYVQYAHARVHSVFRKARDELPGVDYSDKALQQTSLDCLTDEAEVMLMKKLADWPRTVESAAAAHEPHRIAFYLNDLAALFHALWNRGNEDPGLRFLRQEAPGESLARLALIRSTALVVSSGLSIMGVVPLEEMH